MESNSGRNTSDKNESRSHKRRGHGDGDSSSRRKGATSSRKHRSSKAKERSSKRRERNEGRGEPEVDLIGWGTDPATSVDPPLLLQDAPSSATASAADPVPAPAPVGKAMRAPPSSLQASTWESDLSAILSAAAPIAAAGPATIDAPVPTPPSGTAAEVTVRVGADAGENIGTDGGVGGEVESVGSVIRNSRRKSGKCDGLWLVLELWALEGTFHFYSIDFDVVVYAILKGLIEMVGYCRLCKLSTPLLSSLLRLNEDDIYLHGKCLQFLNNVHKPNVSVSALSPPRQSFSSQLYAL